MAYVVAILDQDTFKVFSPKQKIPEGALVIKSWQDLRSSISMQTMDRIRSRLLGDQVPPSTSRDEAAKRLWHVMMLGVNKRKNIIDYSFRKKDVFGNMVHNKGRVELLQLTYSAGEDRRRDFFYKRLKPQAKQILQILIDDGRGIWTNEEATSLIVEKGGAIQTVQSLAWLFGYYRSFLVNYKLIKRVSYADFAKSQDQAFKTAFKPVSE